MVHESENSEEDEFTVKVKHEEDSREDSKEDELAVEVDYEPDEPDSTDERDSTADERLPPFFGLPTPLLHGGM